MQGFAQDDASSQRFQEGLEYFVAQQNQGVTKLQVAADIQQCAGG
ncbi:hypothetical protein GCM10009621_08830 [Corynebacterium felinum]